MSDSFDCVTQYVFRICNEEQLCVHAGDAEHCEIMRHPTYERLRAKAIMMEGEPKPTRLWESMVAMGRLYDMRGDDKWRMIVLDCVISSLRGRSLRISRDLYVDLSDVRSDMFEAGLATWTETVRGVPPRRVPAVMRKTAIRAAYQRATDQTRETVFERPEDFLNEDGFPELSGLKASSLIHGADFRNPAVAEQLRGERNGALFHKNNCMNSVTRFHEDIRAGRRPDITARAAKAPMLARSNPFGPSHYYYISDFLPPFIGMPAAAEALGIPESAAYHMVRKGTFPCPPTRMGRSLKVPVRPLMHYMDIPDVIVHPDDVENGAAHASGLARQFRDPRRE
ncbi:helix-turn-helix transcriptional regulator [Streptomyces sp. CA-288835]|uniref:helix-turn-helix transcriptional regulator n=1 Tax=Streptomyces sp. CA-288835 TaxID=3240069 RepID=UPI003D8FE1D4